MKTPKQDSKSSQTVTSDDWQDPDDYYRNDWGAIIERAESHDRVKVPAWTPTPVEVGPLSFWERSLEWIGIAILIGFALLPIILLLALILLYLV